MCHTGIPYKEVFTACVQACDNHNASHPLQLYATRLDTLLLSI